MTQPIFQLEPRYWVFKRKHLNEFQDYTLRKMSEGELCDAAVGDCIVVPSNAPHYEYTLLATRRQWMEDQAALLKEPKQVEFVWALDGETFLSSNIVPSLGEAIEAARRHRDSELGDPLDNYCSVGTVRRYTAREFYPDAGQIFDYLMAQACETEAGEWAANSDWLHRDTIPYEIANKLTLELHAVLDNFFLAHPEYQPGDKFFLVENSEDYQLDPDEE